MYEYTHHVRVTRKYYNNTYQYVCTVRVSYRTRIHKIWHCVYKLMTRNHLVISYLLVVCDTMSLAAFKDVVCIEDASTSIGAYVGVRFSFPRCTNTDPFCMPVCVRIGINSGTVPGTVNLLLLYLLLSQFTLIRSIRSLFIIPKRIRF